MEKSLGKAFIVSLIILMVMSLLFHTIGYYILGTIDHHMANIVDHPSFFVWWLTSPSTWFPWEMFTEIIDPSTTEGLKVMYIGYLAALIVASIIAAIFGGDFSKSLGGWFLTTLVCTILLIAIVFIDSYNISWICFGCDIGHTVVQLIIIGVINFSIFGGVTLLTVLVIGSYGK